MPVSPIGPSVAAVVLYLPDDLVAGDVIVRGHGDTSSLEHEPPRTIKQFRCHAIAACYDRDAAPVGQRLLNNPQLFGGTPAVPPAAIGDDLYLRHTQVLRHRPKPSWVCSSVWSKEGPVQLAMIK